MIYDNNIQRKGREKVTFCLIEEGLFDIQSHGETGYRIYQVVTQGELVPLSDKVRNRQDLALELSKSIKVSINYGDTLTTIPAPKLTADDRLGVIAQAPVPLTDLFRFMTDYLKHEK